MNYRLTVNFTSEESITTWDYDISDPAPFFKLALKDIDPKNIKSFRLDKLENGKPIKQPKCFKVAELSVDDQREIA